LASYEQSKASKLWSVRFRILEGGDEKNKRLSGFRTKKEAAAGYLEFMKDYELNRKAYTSTSPLERLKFKALVEYYLQYKKSRVKYSSYYTMVGKIEKYIVPFFKDKYIDQIKPVDIINWQEYINSLGFSHSYKSSLNTYLSSIYKHGDKYYDIINVMLKVDGFRDLEPKKKMLYWTIEEFRSFISACDNTTYNTFFKLLYITGCRKGEALALSWDDIDFNSKSVSISKSVTRKVKDAAWLVTTPKNKSSYRVIDLPQSFIDELKTYKQWQTENYKRVDFLFCGERPLPERTTDRYFIDCCERAGVKKIRIHDLRHSCASLLISEGVSIVAVSNRLGHKDVKQTLNTYSHLMPADTDKSLSILSKI